MEEPVRVPAALTREFITTSMELKAPPVRRGPVGGGPTPAISGHDIGGNAIGERTGGRKGDEQCCVVIVGSVGGHGQSHVYSKIPHESDF